MATMNLPAVRARLEDERQRLAEEIEALRRTDLESEREREGAGRGNHMADDATETFEHEKALALIQNLRVLGEKVERALQKLDQGTYGVCDECGKPIAPERLEAIPYATMCISCKAKRERR